MHISNIKIENYRNFLEFEMDFQKGLNVIIGANNSGKTNLLKAIELIKNPTEKLLVEDFNKNYLLQYVRDIRNNKIDKNGAPKIKISYQVEHEVSEDDTENGSILNLISFLGFDDIEKQKEKLKVDNDFDSVVNENNITYYLVANIKTIYSIDPKQEEAFMESIKNVTQLTDLLDVLEIFNEHYSWKYVNGSTDMEADKKAAKNIFEVNFIEAERETEAIYKETSKEIKKFIADPKNAELIQEMRKNINKEMESTIGSVLQDIQNVIETEANDVGLEQGDISIGQDIHTSISPVDSYKINVLDNQNKYSLPLTHNGVGYNNLINIYILMNLNKLRGVDESRIICFEEPEAHLHPAMQYKLFSYLRKISEEDVLSQQIFVSTHSPNITAVAGLDNIYVLDYMKNNFTNKKNNDSLKNLDVVSVDLEKQMKDHKSSKDHLAKFLDVTRSDMLFAKRIILVEGISEKLLLPKLIERLNYSYEDEHISIVEIGGKHFHYFLDLFRENDLNKKVLCITDKDYTFLKNGQLQKLEYYKSYQPKHVKELKNKYEDCKNFCIKYQQSYGQTFEDELIYYNLINSDNKTVAKEMLRIALVETLQKTLSDNGMNYDLWVENEEKIDGRNKKSREYLELFNKKIRKDKSHSKIYKNLFFAKLFLYYAEQKKGEVALRMLTNEDLMEKITVPDYIEEGIHWLLQ